MKSNLTKYLSLGLLIVFISSCANIEITKRRYRPGYHIDLVKKNDRKVKHENEVAIAEVESNNHQQETSAEVATETKSKAELRKERKAERKAEKAAEVEPEAPAEFAATTTDKAGILDVKPFENFDKKTRESAFRFQNSRFAKKLRKTVKPYDDEKTKWSILAIISAGLGIIAFAILILAIAAAATAATAGGPLTSMYTLGGIAAAIGVGAMVTGIIGMRDTREKKGRGFAIGGMIAGIVGLVIGLILLLWGLFFTALGA